MLRVFNSLTREKEDLIPLKDKEISIYTCGPTVYSDIHIGNLRTFLAFDIIKRYLIYKGYKVTHVQNMTDVGHLTEDDMHEDKIVKAAMHEDMTPFELADRYIERYFHVMEEVNWIKPDINPRAAEHITEIIQSISSLIDKGYAYEVDGSVYFDISKYKDYGRLSGNTLERLEEGASGRVGKEQEEKRNKHDFALWIKASKEHLMRWDSPWGVGYPGWHIECSVMSQKYLGVPFDIHGGGKDLRFPHHENEIAQSCSLNDTEFARYWIHTEFLLIDGDKMSKSKGSFIIAKDFIEKHGHMPVRFLLISKHYQTEMNITKDSISSAKEAFFRLQNTYDNALSSINDCSDHSIDKALSEAGRYEKRFILAMDNNFNTPEAIAVLFDISKEINTEISSERCNPHKLKDLLDIFTKLSGVLGFKYKRSDTEIPEEIERLVQEREESRKDKDFKRADELRDRIKEKGYLIEDSPKGINIKKI